MKVDIFDLSGNAVEKIDLPKVFETPVREDLILRAVLSTLSKKRQPYGADVLAGLRTSAHYHGSRHHRYSMMNREMARMPRLHGKTVPFLYFQARMVPQAVKGREAHPPKAEKIWIQRINDKERKLAIKSAIAASTSKDLIMKRGHRVNELKSFPIVVENNIQEISKTKQLMEFLKKIGLEKELERIKEKKIRAGKGKRRGRRYRKKVGPLFVITEDKGISRAAKNITGCDVIRINNISAEYLAPGAVPGRLTIFTKSSIEKLGDWKG